MRIRDVILEGINNVRERMAQAIIHDGDWPALGRDVARVSVAALVALAVAVIILALAKKILGTLLGKIFSVPLILLIIGLLYDNFLAGSRNKRKAEHEAEKLEVWAGRAYEYVRDSMFYVVQAMADRMKCKAKLSPRHRNGQ